MRRRRLLQTGVVGTIVAALGCFTPALVLLLGAFGLSAAVGWLDYVLFPVFAASLGIVGYALWQGNSA